MISLQDLIEQPLVHRFGLTLLHFLWQGALAAIVMAFVFPRLRRRSAESRYLASVVGLGLMAVLPVVTFWLIEVPAAPAGDARLVTLGQMNAFESLGAVGRNDFPLAPGAAERSIEQRPDLLSEAQPTQSTFSPAGTTDEHTRTGAEGWMLANLTWVTGWVDHIRPLLPWIVCAWSVGVLFFSTRLAGGWLFVVRLKRHSTQAVAQSLVRTVNHLSTQLRIRRAVTLLESTLVTVPSMVGFFRPVILLPASALTGLSPEQLESLLAHELAHIRRHDYLVNAVQCIIETLLFYHPAVWWLSGRIRAERENCCDDLAVSISGSRLLYARALAEMAKLGQRQHQLAAAADGADLASRIRRVMGIANVAPERLSSWWAGAILLAILGGMALLLSPLAIMGAAQAAVDEAAAAKENTESEDNASSEEPPEDPVFRVFDSFDGKLELDWEVVRPDPTHVSLEKNPGRLTITSQLGGLFSEVRTGNSAKNVYLVPNPATGGGDFVVTTCLELFHPEVPYQQAGPHIYDDDDNYLKAIIARNYQGVLIGCSWETSGEFGGRDLKAGGIEWDRLWLRIIKRGRAYESSYSLDGKEYTVIAERLWGNGAPKRIGLAVMNEEANPNPLDAAFEFFEVRSLTDEEKNDPLYLERRKLQGTWQVVSSRLGAAVLAEAPLSSFVFHGMEVTFSEHGQRITSKYVLRPDKDPKELVLTGLGRELWRDHTREFVEDRNLVNAVYSIEQDRLVISMDPRPNAPAPAELKTNEGDGRLLIELRRMSEVEIAALERNRQPRQKYFKILDENHDDHLALAEFLTDYPRPEAVEQGTELFKILDRDGDENLSLAEFQTRPHRATFLEMDLNADGRLSEREFAGGEMKSASPARARRVFELIDQDNDGLLSGNEFFARPQEAWFTKLDTDEDDRMTLDEYAAGNPGLVRANRCQTVFALIDRNGDRRASLDEFTDKPLEVFFIKLDADCDDKLSLQEFLNWKHTPEQVAAAKKQFTRKDTDGDALVSFKEYAYRSEDAEFWKADEDGDNRLSLAEFKAGGLSLSGDQAEAAFNAIDQNGDGRASLAEFKARSALEKAQRD